MLAFHNLVLVLYECVLLLGKYESWTRRLKLSLTLIQMADLDWQITAKFFKNINPCKNGHIIVSPHYKQHAKSYNYACKA